jgi:hypothetical protein
MQFVDMDYKWSSKGRMDQYVEIFINNSKGIRYEHKVL